MTTPRPKRKPGPRQRRMFLRSVVYTAGITAFALLGYVPIIGQWAKRLRPPGALLEQEFYHPALNVGNAYKCAQ